METIKELGERLALENAYKAIRYERAQLLAINAQLLEALKEIAESTARPFFFQDIARAAIAAAESK